MSFSKTIVVGNLGADPLVRTLAGGQKVAQISVATNETYKNKEGEKVQKTAWHTLILWRGAADFAEKYLKKGDQVVAEGKLQYRSFDDKDNVKRFITEIKVDNLRLLHSVNKPVASIEEAAQGVADQDAGSEPDDLPF